MPFWRKKKRRSTEHIETDFGSIEITTSKRRGELPLLDITLTLNPDSFHGLAFQNNRDKLGLYHPETLHELHLYANALSDLPDKRDTAIELLEWLVAVRDDDEENRLLALTDLTRTLRHTGQLALAEQRLREALTGWERLRGQDDAQTLRTATSLAGVLIDLGRREEAEGMMRDTVARSTRTLGPTHPDTLRGKETLAGTLRGSPARLQEAERMYQAILENTDGATDDDADDLVLTVRSDLAAVLAHQGKHAEALEMYRDLVDAEARRRGEDHPDTLSARQNHAVVLHSLGHVAEAEAQLTKVLEGCRRVHGPRHDSTLNAQVNLAAIKANQGRAAEARPLLRDAIDGYRSTHGPNHPIVHELTAALAHLDNVSSGD